jgi:5,10-methylenetetrahydromethanopterin reductase
VRSWGVPLRFGFSANPSDVAETADAARQGEALGFDRIGVWDSPALYREPWVTLAAVAAATHRIDLGTWVTNPLTRHPVVTASAAATLDDLAPGRVVLGIGTGDSGVYGLGGSAATLRRLAEYVTALRSLLREGSAVWEGSRVSLPWAGPRDVRILVAAHGAKALRVAAQVADGAVLGLGVSPDVVARCRAELSDAAAAAGRDAGGFETWWTAPWYVGDDGDAARDEALWHVASLAHHISRRGVAGKFIPERYVAGILELGAAYDLTTHGAPGREQRDAYAALARRLGVADYLVDRFTIAGTPAEAATRVRHLAAAGADRLDCANDSERGHLLDRPRAWAASVLPLLTPAAGRGT